MKLVTFETAAGLRHIGALRPGEQEIVDLTAVDPVRFPDMLGLIDGGPAALDRARQVLAEARGVLPLAEQRLLAPLPEPRQIRDFLCFEQHLRQARANRHLFGLAPGPQDPAKIQIPEVWYRLPLYYKCNRFSVVGPEAEIEWPPYCRVLDYELEFGFVTGRRGRDISREAARDYIFGYCIFNDVSARDTQLDEMQGQLGPCKGKDFDTGNILGPWLVTADEIPDPYALTMLARINGEEVSRGQSGTMQHKFEDMLARASESETIHPGEFFGSGTVGNGCGLEHGRFLAAGDVIELEVSGLGCLRNRVRAPRR